ncbi:MAG: immunity protein TriTu family protein [Segniliparus sp.]|uniref:immunity protein TriTu family protein n=1 Tax=Segniliparus sp. TaxID=2804064 RepID=UPI003F37260F
MINDYVAQWFAQNEDRFGSLGLTASISVSEGMGSLPKASVKIDLDSAARLGTITCWSTGETNLDVVEIESEEMVASKYFELEQEEETLEVLDNFVKLVSGDS